MKKYTGRFRNRFSFVESTRLFAEKEKLKNLITLPNSFNGHGGNLNTNTVSFDTSKPGLQFEFKASWKTNLS